MKRTSTMDDKRSPSFDRLPVEILYRILDHLDCQTIRFSFGHVCRRFYGVANTFYRYELNLNLISKSTFDVICRSIRPENVISVTVSDGLETPGQIELFLSLFRISRFTQLRHLTLIQIDERAQNRIARQLSRCPLVSLSIDTRGQSLTPTKSIISLVVEQGNLRTLSIRCSSLSRLLDKMAWPVHCTIEHLTIQKCMQRQLFALLNALPRLQTFILDFYTMGSGNITIPNVHSSLISLTINDSDISMTNIESIASVTPSLVYLKLVNTGHDFPSISNGTRWEELIQSRLTELDNFEFFFVEKSRWYNNHQTNVETVIEPFRKPFWSESKRWFVCCEFNTTSNAELRLYSIPVCQTNYKYSPNCNYFTTSTLTQLEIQMDRVSTLHINLTTSTDSEKNHSKKIFFPKVTDVQLKLDGERPLGSIQFLSTLIDLQNLVKISINLVSKRSPDFNPVDNVGILLERAPNVRSLAISTDWVNDNYLTSVKEICSILPQNIRHFQVKIRSRFGLKEILEQVEHLSSVSFRFPHRSNGESEDVLSWLLEKGTEFTSWTDWNTFQIWISKNGTKPNESIRSNKRLKVSFD